MLYIFYSNIKLNMYGNVKKYGFIFYYIEMIIIKVKKYIIVKNVKNICIGICYVGFDFFRFVFFF